MRHLRQGQTLNKEKKVIDMLKIWLPLNKDERNIGLHYCNVTNNGATFFNGDTEGNCFEFNPAASSSGTKYLRLSASTADILENGGSFTFSAFIKITGSFYSNGAGVICANAYQSNGIGLLVSKAKKIKMQMCYGTSEREWEANTVMSENVWHHICVTYLKETRKLTAFLDGVEDGSFVLAGDWTHHPTYKISIGLGTQGGWGYTFPGLMKNIRIYDHVLRDWEIKKLYNSCFYELESNIHLRATTNLMAGKDYSVRTLTTAASTTNDADGGKYINTGSRQGSYSSDSIRLEMPSTVGMIEGKDYSVSYDYKVGSGSGNLHQGLDVNDGTPTVVVTNKENGVKHVEVLIPSGCPHYSYNTYRFIDFNKIAQNSRYKVWRFQVEEGLDPTPYTPSNRDERFVDMSGFDNEVVPYNITQSGTSLYFNGTNSAIKVPIAKVITGGTWSLNVWFYRPNGQFGTKNWETLVGGPSGFELESTSSSTKTAYICPYSWGGGKFAYEMDKWNMVTLTRTSSGSKLYLNGELIKSGSAGSVPNGDYFLGSWQAYNKQNFKGYMKRFSIYTKVLSDDDVMNLYLHNE